MLSTHLDKPRHHSLILGTVADLARSKLDLIQQLIVLGHNTKCPHLSRADRILLVILIRLTRTWRSTLFIIQPATSCYAITTTGSAKGSTG